MGDATRLFNYVSNEIHTGIVVRYAQNTTHKVVTNVYEIDLDNKQLLWGSVTLEDIQALDKLVRSMPNGKRDLSIDNAIKLKKKELNSKSGIVSFNPKIDSKTQRRLQCSITNFASKVGFIKHVSAGPIVRGIAIALSIASGRRIRKNSV
jgi:hypothetical protein